MYGFRGGRVRRVACLSGFAGCIGLVLAAASHAELWYEHQEVVEVRVDRDYLFVVVGCLPQLCCRVKPCFEELGSCVADGCDSRGERFDVTPEAYLPWRLLFHPAYSVQTEVEELLVGCGTDDPHENFLVFVVSYRGF